MDKKIATREAYGKVLVEIGETNKDVVVLDADLSKSTKTYEFSCKFPERFFNMGVAEANMIATAAGLATAGKVPFCSTFAVFATGRAFDQIRNSVAYPKLNVKIAATHAGVTVGEDGGSHQSIEDIALIRALPGFTVFVPADAIETREVIKAALEIDGPVYIRLGRLAVPVIHDSDFKFVPGKALELRDGSDVAIIATGLMVSLALEAADILLKDNIKATVLDVHTIKPLDVETIVSVAIKTGAVVTAEEHNVIGGLGSAVAEALCEHNPVPLKRIGIQDMFGESGKPVELLKHFGLTAEDIVNAVYEVLKKKSKNM